MISEGSCDTEDWSIDAEYVALIAGIKHSLKYIQIENSLNLFLSLFIINLFFTVFF